MDTTIDQLIRLELPAARGGDHAAYGRIVSACQNTVTAIALAIVRDVPSSEDIAQDAFLSAWQHLRRLHNPDSFLPWLRQITRNLARDHLRANKRALHKVDFASDDQMDAAIAAAADPAPSPPDVLIDEERTRAAADLISALVTTVAKPAAGADDCANSPKRASRSSRTICRARDRRLRTAASDNPSSSATCCELWPSR